MSFKTALLGSLAAGAIFLGVGVNSASAAPVTFTWDPFGGGISSPGSIFTANNITVADYAVISIPVNPTIPGSIVETGFLATTAFGLQPPSVSMPGYVNGTGGGAPAAQPGATPYQLFLSFTSTSHLNPVAPGIFAGAFDSVSYTLVGDIGGTCQFSPTGLSGCGATVNLETGTLAAASTPTGTLQNTVSIVNGNPAASVLLSFNELVPGFFVSPPSFVTLQMESSFTNTPGVVTRSPANCPDSGLPCTITIDGGGGNLSFIAVPEPSTIALFGTGLLGLGWLARRRRVQS